MTLKGVGYLMVSKLDRIALQSLRGEKKTPQVITTRKMSKCNSENTVHDHCYSNEALKLIANFRL